MVLKRMMQFTICFFCVYILTYIMETKLLNFLTSYFSAFSYFFKWISFQKFGSVSQACSIGSTFEMWWSSINITSGSISYIHHFHSKYAACIGQICFIYFELSAANLNCPAKFSTNQFPWFGAKSIDCHIIGIGRDKSNLWGIVHQNDRNQSDC